MGRIDAVRVKALGRSSGGVLVYAKSELSGLIESGVNQEIGIVWVSFAENIFVFAYIRPEGSVHAKRDIFNALTDWITVKQLTKGKFRVFVMADFNARTAGLSDMWDGDEELD